MPNLRPNAAAIEKGEMMKFYVSAYAVVMFLILCVLVFLAGASFERNR